MKLFDFFKSNNSNSIDREPIYDTSGSSNATTQTDAKPTESPDDYLNRINGLESPFGSIIRNYQYVDSNFRTYGIFDSSNFQFMINVSRLWYKNNIPDPNRIFNQPVFESYYAMATPGYYGGLSKIIVDDNGIKGYNETEIQKCIVDISISKVANGYNIVVLSDLNISRKVYLDIYKGNSMSQVDQKGLSKIPHSFNIKIDRRSVVISDLSQIHNALEKIAGWIKEEVENNFKEEAHLYKKRLYTSEILFNYRKKITTDSVMDMLVHINDALGNPNVSKSQDVIAISYAIGPSTDGLVRLDKKMSDALYEISEFTGRIKSIYDKITVDIKITGGSLILTVRPDTIVDGDNLAWMDYTYTGPILDINTPMQGTASVGRFGTQSFGQSYGQFISE